MKRRIIKSVRMTEISATESPAHGDAARVVMMKRSATPAMPERKPGESDEDYAARCKEMQGGMAKKTPTDGMLADAMGKSEAASATEAEQVGEGSTMAEQAKSSPEADKLAAAEREKADLAKRVADLQVLAEASDAEKAFAKSLPAEAVTAFWAAKPDARQADMAKAKDANPVVYTAVDGTEFRKSDDKRFVDMAKRNDSLAKALAATQAEKRDMELRKRADDFPHLPGDVETKVAMLKAVETIEDQAVRGRVYETMKAQNTAMAKNFATIGHANVPGKGGEFATMAKRIAGEKKITVEQAEAELAATTEGQRLFLEGVS